MLDNTRPDFDQEIIDICRYVTDYRIDSEEAYRSAYYNLLDSLACAFMALSYPDCTKLLGPVVPFAVLENGARVPGTDYELDPVQAAFNLGAMIRWLDFNDTWLAAEWGHPSDNIGGILSVADYLNRNPKFRNTPTLTLKDVLTAMIKAHEIQGILALENSFNRVGLDHVVLVKVATTAVVTQLLGGSEQEICNALSQAWVDGQSLRTYRHAPNTGSRKSWAAGDATSRGVRLSLIAITGETGYSTALSAKQWGFYDVSFKGNAFVMKRPYSTYVMEHILFKISYPAEFHSQTAAEAAVFLHEQVKHRLDEVDKIVVKTQESAMRIINKEGPLYNPADRDHCLQYVIAVGLIYGDITAEHYEDDIAKDPRIDLLREKMQVSEKAEFSEDYLDPDKRSIGNSVQVCFKDGSCTEEISIEYPIGHRRRRREGIPLLMEKFHHSLESHFEPTQAEQIIKLTDDMTSLMAMPVNEFVSALVKKNKL